MLGGLNPCAEIAGRKRCPRDEMVCSGAEALDRATFLDLPRLVIERRMCEQHPRRSRGGKRRRSFVFAQPAPGFRLELECGSQIDPIGVQRVSVIAVADSRAAEDATKTAHDDRDLRGRVARLVVEPQDLSQSLDAHGPALRDAEDTEGNARLATPQLVLGEPFD